MIIIAEEDNFFLAVVENPPPPSSYKLIEAGPHLIHKEKKHSVRITQQIHTFMGIMNETFTVRGVHCPVCILCILEGR